MSLKFRQGMRLIRISPVQVFYLQKLHCVSKNVPPLTCYIRDKHGSITMIFGKNITEKVGNQSVLYVPTSSNWCFCTIWGSRKPGNCVFSLKCCIFFTKNTRNTL